MRLISWNVNGRVANLGKQSQALRDQCPDLVALQEIRLTTVANWREQLAQNGLQYRVDSFALQGSRVEGTGPRRYGEILASRWPLSPLPPFAFPVPWPERVVSALLQSPWGMVTNSWLVSFPRISQQRCVYTRCYATRHAIWGDKSLAKWRDSPRPRGRPSAERT
jgi:hypothetical protein